MPLVNASIATTLAALVQLGGSNPATAAEGTVGLTTDPVNPQAPQWTINVTHSGDGDNRRYFGQVVVNANSDQGTNASHYLAAGIYETNLAIDMTAYNAAPNVRDSLCPFEGYDDDRVYLYLTAPIALRNRDAELEHCADHVYAYNNSLVQLDNALAAVAARGRFGPFTTADAATARVTSEIGLALPVALRGVAMTRAAWVAEYLRLCGESSQRDIAGYHTFGLQLLGAAPAGAITYLTGAARDGAGVTPRFVQLTNGTTAIGVHASATFIV
ncbi:hypothetical protein Cme02nite_05210 [Catellatospora methionotrophica]|uniref:Uncharacterized protein n=1 Tax=Catellatospora methionotrophica TaxID=121620 RepID=A0A8J3LAN3_9ACTN|nr:hypothetical protein [Catellatospora methionotrophica]GIG12189.1 hypothetical protein Cme02nite_05210 [Catellatospora methionotrophica]